MYQLSIYADTVYLDLSFEERAKGYANGGFRVEFCDWRGCELDFIPTNNIPIATFSASGPRSLPHPDYIGSYLQFASGTFPIAKQPYCSTLMIQEGKQGVGDKAQFMCPLKSP